MSNGENGRTFRVTLSNGTIYELPNRYKGLLCGESKSIDSRVELFAGLDEHIKIIPTIPLETKVLRDAQEKNGSKGKRGYGIRCSGMSRHYQARSSGNRGLY